MTDTWDAMSDWAFYNYKEAELKYGYKEKELSAASEMAAMSMMQSSEMTQSQLTALEISGEQQAVQLHAAEKQSTIWSGLIAFTVENATKIVIAVAIIGAITAAIVGISGILGKRKRPRPAK